MVSFPLHHCSAYLLVLETFVAFCPLCHFTSVFLFSLIFYPIPLFLFSSLSLSPLHAAATHSRLNLTYGPLLYSICRYTVDINWLYRCYLSRQSTFVMIHFCQTLLVILTTVIFLFTMLYFTSRGWKHWNQSPLFAP